MAEREVEERNWSMLAHASAAATSLIPPALGFLGPLVVWLLWRDRSARITRHARQALVFQIAVAITVWILGVVGTALTCIGVGWLLLLAAGIPWLAGILVPLFAAWRVNQGDDDFVYPIVGHLDGGSQPPRLH